VTLVFLLQIREDAKKGVHVENLTEHEVSSAREAMQQLIEVKFIKAVASFSIDTFS
jgi:kinesin family member 15